jgi:hypothetical protein
VKAVFGYAYIFFLPCSGYLTEAINLVLPVARGQYGGCEKQYGSSRSLHGDKRAPTLVFLGSSTTVSTYFIYTVPESARMTPLQHIATLIDNASADSLHSCSH